MSESLDVFVVGAAGLAAAIFTARLKPCVRGFNFQWVRWSAWVVASALTRS